MHSKYQIYKTSNIDNTYILLANSGSGAIDSQLKMKRLSYN